MNFRLSSTYLLLLVLIFIPVLLMSQSLTDSITHSKYPLVIGNTGFSTDSTEIVVGEIPRGEISTFTFEIYNFSNEQIAFSDGKSNRFVSIKFMPNVLAKESSGTMIVEFNADTELDLGEFYAEISIASNDTKNPYKFMNLVMNLVEGSAEIKNQSIDTVPNIVFDHYNYDFGHHTRGKVIFHTFVMTNMGSESLYISDIELPKDIKIVDRPVEPLMSGEKSIIRLKINTRGKIGVLHQSVIVHSNDPSDPVVILGLHGSVRVLPSHKKTSVQCNEHQQRF
jgi:uncharacterized protein DUF1573